MRAVSLILLTLLPASARADTALLIGVAAGASFEDALRAPAPHFRLGAGADLIFSGGLAMLSRVELLHDLDGSLAVGAGWLGPGLVEGDGLPLGLALVISGAAGPNGGPRVGGGARGLIGLWYARAVIELDLSVRRPLDRNRPDRTDLAFGVSLRVVPWVL